MRTNKIKENKKIAKKATIGIIITFILFSPGFLYAEDYPAGYVGPGFREYLNGKIQNGYFIDVFTRIDNRQKERVNKKNQIEEILSSSYQATPVSAYGILSATHEQKNNSDYLNIIIALRRREREKGASAQGEFNYLPHSDGKIEYFTDGLVTRVENERVPDEFGNISIRNSYNYKYNDDRLLVSFQADTRDNLGNVTHVRQFGMRYTPDSVFYATDETNANKNIIEYFVEEIDSAENKREVHFYGGIYQGKFLTAFSQTIEEKVGGDKPYTAYSSFTRDNITYSDPKHMLSYHEEGTDYHEEGDEGTEFVSYILDRKNITYNGKDQITGYEEVIHTRPPNDKKGIQPRDQWTETIIEAKFDYFEVPHQFGPDVEPDPNRILESTITVTTENPDGSNRKETIVTSYDYNAYHQLIGAKAKSKFSGQEPKWFEYKDKDKNLLSRKDKDGKVTYSYVGPDKKEKGNVPEDQVIETLRDGNKFEGTSEIEFEILYGRPLAKKSRTLTSYSNPEDNKIYKVEDSTVTSENGLKGLRNSLLRLLSSHETTKITYPNLDPDNTHIETQDIVTLYNYDTMGNLIGAKGEGKREGYEYSSERGFWGKYNETSEKLDQLPLGLTFSGSLKDKISYDSGRKLLIFKGVMSEEEKNTLLGLSKDKAYQEAIDELFQKSHNSTITIDYEVILGRLLRKTYDEDKDYE